VYRLIETKSPVPFQDTGLSEGVDFGSGGGVASDAVAQTYGECAATTPWAERNYFKAFW
jgi:hypothetical protein